MMRVLLGVTVAQTANSFLVDQAQDLVRRGLDVHLVTSFSDDQAADLKATFNGVFVHRVDMTREIRLAADLRSLICWIQVIREVRPSVVIASTPKAALLAMSAAKMLRVRTRIFHVRGLRHEGLKGAKRAITRELERFSAVMATSVMCDSASLEEVAAGSGMRISRKKIVMLGMGSCCGVDTHLYRPPSDQQRETVRTVLGLGPHDIAVGFVGRVTEDKGIIQFLGAIRVLRARGFRVQGVVAGPFEGSRVLAQDLDRAVQENVVAYLGPISNPLETYWAMDVFCFPSMREGFPIAPLEAQACGLPIVTTTATGCRDAVLAGSTGLVVRAGDVDALSQALEHFCLNPDQRRSMGNAGRKWAKAHFERQMVVNRFSDWIINVSA